MRDRFPAHGMFTSASTVGNLVLDDETDLLAESEDEVCRTCGCLLVEDEADPLILFCPVCDVMG